ncbi:DUF4352 domain-containing protein [Nonomuraea sp. NPDC050394]|uniref:DUF4352 domain-containing protein n=1 Tax=Nonomuraea sp. NPDC050394 TaxID=3364363 RepID=UPI0037B5C661
MSERLGEMPPDPGLPQNPFTPPPHHDPSCGAPPSVQPRKHSRAFAFVMLCIGAVVGALGVLGAIAAMDGYGPFAPQAPMGQVVTVGDFRIVVIAVERQGPVEGMSAELIPQGEFVLVRMSVQNTGSSAQTFAVAPQKLQAGGAEYDSVRVRETGPTFDRIPPGGTASGPIVFDVPEGAQLEAVELHGSAFSWGAKVKVSEG